MSNRQIHSSLLIAAFLSTAASPALAQTAQELEFRQRQNLAANLAEQKEAYQRWLEGSGPKPSGLDSQIRPGGRGAAGKTNYNPYAYDNYHPIR